jgi:transposase-like protein
MTKAQRGILRKRRVLEHAERIGNIRRTCRYFGVSRSTFYLWKKLPAPIRSAQSECKRVSGAGLLADRPVPGLGAL